MGKSSLAYKEFMAEMEAQEKENVNFDQELAKKARRKISSEKFSEDIGGAQLPVPRALASFENFGIAQEWFARRVALKIDLDEQIKELTNKRARVASKISTYVEQIGLDVITDKGSSRALFVSPFKAQIRYETEGGDINIDAVRKHFPEMIVTESSAGKLDLQGLEQNLKNINGLTVLEHEKAIEAMALLRSLALKLGNEEVYAEQEQETVKDEFLVRLNEGKIAPHLKAEILGNEVKILNPGSLRIEALVKTGHGRCGCCGYEKKASEAKDPNFNCQMWTVK